MNSTFTKVVIILLEKYKFFKCTLPPYKLDFFQVPEKHDVKRRDTQLPQLKKFILFN